MLYAGTGNTTQNITGVGFQPDWVWIKNRTQSSSHYVLDSVRGLKDLHTNDTSAEGNSTGRFNSFDSDGFQVEHSGGGGGFTNGSGQNYVAWNWEAGGYTVTNTNGSLSSQVRASTTAGFSIVTYTGAGAARTVGHGLGVVPQAIIVKTRSSNDHWAVYHQNVGNTKILYLNLTNSAATSSNYWNNTTPTSTVFSIGSDNKTGKSGDNYVAYVFSDVDGFSKFGSFVGNGNDNGTFVYTGFSVAWLMIKRSDGSNTNWTILDNKRNTFNVTNARLFSNSSEAETVSGSGVGQVDLLSNGFKARDSHVDGNGNGNNYVYFAFAEAPYKNARAR